MKAIFDTNILIDYLQGRAEAARELERYEGKLISTVTCIEVLVGARGDKEGSLLRSFLAGFTICELSQSVAEMAIRLRREHRLKVPDAIIYATAREQGCLLVTRNNRDFSAEWPDVRVPYE